MLFFSWLGKRTSRQSTKRQPRKRTACFRPRVEAMEGRTLPSTFTVNTTLDVVDPNDGKLSLREAITRANNNPGADTIALPAGVFRSALTGAGENANATGDFDITDALTIRGAGAGLTILNAQRVDRVLDVLGAAPHSFRVVLEDLAVRSGNVTGDGGAVQLNNADLTTRDCTISSNEASGFGGGIYTAPGTGDVSLIRTTVVRNTGGSGGGGVAVSSSGSMLSVRDSSIRSNFTPFNGGGLLASGTTATLSGSTLSGNIANLGGGGLVAGTANLTRCTVSGNSAAGLGGASILGGGGLVADTATLTDCTVSGNYVAGVGDGGGILAFGTATLTDCSVRGNTARDGVGGGVTASTVKLIGGTVSGNSARDGGGGVNADSANFNRSTISGNVAFTGDGGGLRAATATLSKCTFDNNMALGGSGGGIRATSALNLTSSTVSNNVGAGDDGGGISAETANLINCTISGNSTRGYGGGLFVDTSGSLLNCTIADNTATGGGGVYLSQNPASPPVLTIRNTIIAMNQVYLDASGPDVEGAAFSSEGHNLIGVGGAGFTNGVDGDIVGSNQNPIDPKLGALANNGGPAKTQALLVGSLAIDAGDNNDVQFTDQRGSSRIKDGNGDGAAIVDIGAFER